jgi:hypothetical protein
MDSIGSGDYDEYKVPRSALQQVLEGVAVATRISNNGVKLVEKWISSDKVPCREERISTT